MLFWCSGVCDLVLGVVVVICACSFGVSLFCGLGVGFVSWFRDFCGLV